MFIGKFGVQLFAELVDQSGIGSGNRRREVGIISVIRPFVVQVDSIQLLLLNRPGENIREFFLIIRRQITESDSLMVSHDTKEDLFLVLKVH